MPPRTVAQRAAMLGDEQNRPQVLFESSPSVAAEREIRAFVTYEDTRWLRRLQQEALLR